MNSMMICRLCLNNLITENGTMLFCNANESEIVKIIAKYLLLEITEYDAISTTVCQDCVVHLTEFHKFVKYVEERQNTLQNEFFELKCSFDIHEEPMVEPLIDNNDESLLDMKDDVFVECEIQLCEQQEEFSCAVDVEYQQNAKNGTLRKSAKHLNTETVRRTRKCRQMLSNAMKSKLKTNIEHALDNCDMPDACKEDKPLGKQTSENDNNSDDLIANYLQLKCDLCETSLQTFAKLRAHFKSTHNCTGYAKCCGRRFQKRIKLVEHINMHLNPQYFQCKLCKKNLKTKYSLDLHMQSRHTNKEDLKYVCAICKKRFASKNNLKIHMLAHETEKKYNCELCEKAFVTQYRLKSHVKAIHEKSVLYICDFCGREFKFKPSFDQHVAKHQGVNREPPVQCNICGEWYKHKYGLNKHIKRHNAVKVEVECKHCGKVCPTKVALLSHIRYTHRRQRNLQCSFCEKTFKLKRNLEEHIAMHTGEKHNVCPHCSKEYRSKANMYVHIKRDHFEEWSKKRLKTQHTSLE